MGDPLMRLGDLRDRSLPLLVVDCIVYLDVNVSIIFLLVIIIIGLRIDLVIN